MKTIFLLLFSLSLYAQEIEVELLVFGASYHVDRNYDWNEENPGIGLNLVFPHETKEIFSFFISGGTYKDSYSEQSEFLLVGPRFRIGDKDKLHWESNFGLGYIHGSDVNSIAMVPSMSIGYDWCDLCFICDPNIGDKKNGTVMVAAFLKFRAMTF